MYIQVIGGMALEVDEKTAKILIEAGKATEIKEGKTELIAEKKTRKKINND